MTCGVGHAREARRSPVRTYHRSVPVDFDAVVVGAGPNGLTAAALLARDGWKVLVVEAGPVIGGGTRTEELTLPGFHHDVCSTTHPMALASPAFRDLGLEDHGLRWIHPEVPFAQPLDGARSAIMARSVAETAAAFGTDGRSYRRLMDPLVDRADEIIGSVLGPLVALPRHPLAMARFGRHGALPADRLARRFGSDRPRALVAGMAAHSMLSLSSPATAGVGLMFAILAHTSGFPIAAGGSRAITDALASIITANGGEIRLDAPVDSLRELPSSTVTLVDVSVEQFLRLGGERLPARYRRRLSRFRRGPGVFKIDLALDGPIPWADPELSRTATLHLGGTFEEIAAAEDEVVAGRHPGRPFVLLGQHSLFDPSRAPEGRHTVWAYCHVPNGSTVDQTDAIEGQIERFAPGFRDRIIGRHTMGCAEMERHNRNYAGGDIGGGASNLAQLLARPVLSPRPWETPIDGVFLCSASTPPGAGVHGMCGAHAARLAMDRLRR